MKQLAPLLPKEPLSPEQRKLFDENIKLAYWIAGSQKKKYASELWPAIDQSALRALFAAAYRYTEGKGATFATFATHTIHWTIRLDMRIELHGALMSVEDQAARRARMGYREVGQDASAARACGLLPDVVYLRDNSDQDDNAPVLIDENNPEALLLEAEAEARCQAVLDRASEKMDERDCLIVTRYSVDEDDLSTIGHDLHISRERVRQLRERARKTIRKEFDREFA